jgi:hypothetical protein
MIDKAGSRKWLQQIGNMLKKQEGAAESEDNKRKQKHYDMDKYCDTTEKLA